MSGLAREVVPTLALLLAGWLALWPSRSGLSAWMYHLAAFPVGVLSAALAAGIATLFGRALDVWVVAAAIGILAGFCWSAQAIFTKAGNSTAATFSVRGFLITGAGTLLLSSSLAVLRLTVASFDSIMAYWPMAVGLNRSGLISASVVGSRSPLIPGVGAVYAAFGSDWAHVFYPVFAASLLALIASSLWAGPLEGIPRHIKGLVTGATVVFLATEPSYIFHSFFVHSHMLSSGYLLIAAVSLAFASRLSNGRASFFFIAGLATAGLALARPDGLAYMFVVVIGAISALTCSRTRNHEVFAYFAPAIFVTVGSYAAFFARLGLWSSAKLTGAQAATILSGLLLAAFIPRIIEILDAKVPFRISGESFLAWVTVASIAVNVAAYGSNWTNASAALATARANLFEGAGGYGYLWYAVATVIVFSMFTGDAFRGDSWTRLPFLMVTLFFATAALIHGTSHPGRIGHGDSFNRVAFHALPLITWYAAAVAARILTSREEARSSRTSARTGS